MNTRLFVPPFHLSRTAIDPSLTAECAFRPGRCAQVSDEAGLVCTLPASGNATIDNRRAKAIVAAMNFAYRADAAPQDHRRATSG